MLNSAPPGSDSVSEAPVADAARAAGLQFRYFNAERPQVIAETFDAMLRWNAEGVVVNAAPVST